MKKDPLSASEPDFTAGRFKELAEALAELGQIFEDEVKKQKNKTTLDQDHGKN